MTTILYDHEKKQIAVDSRTSAGGLIKSDITDKSITKEDGSIWFVSGYASEAESFSELSHGDKVNTKFECYALVIKEGKVYSAIEHNGVLSSCELQWNDAIGSGCELAIASLDHGKTAKEAVEYAITKDCYSGGKVRVFDVKTGLELNKSNNKGE